MNEKRYIYWVQWVVLVGAGLLLLLFISAWIRGEGTKEWKKSQRRFAEILRQVDTGAEGAGTEDLERGIFQIELPQFDRVDRCISCHPGIEDARMDTIQQPFTVHPGTFLRDHPLQQYGCTICHGGQGRALTREDAFGRLPGTHWPYPILEQPYIQASCGKCHLAIFDSRGGHDSIVMEGMEDFLRGKTLFSEEGCIGCHKARGVGGILGPDLTRQGEKTRHEYSFQNIAGEQTVSNWLKEHFKDPEMVSRGSQMLQIHLEEKELESLATFVMGLSKPDIPFDYFTMPTLNEFKGIRDPLEGREGYAYLCSACHGKKGEGKSYTDYKTGIPSIGRADFLRVASPEYIRFTLEKGRSLRQMGSWAPPVSGLKKQELDDITTTLKVMGSQPAGNGFNNSPGNADLGAHLFHQYCSTCHGENGSGGVAVALNQAGFLTRAGNEFIRKTMERGRGNTAMPGWLNLGGAKLSDLVAYIDSWDGAGYAERDLDLPAADLEEGWRKYHFLCSRCHGDFGEGETGPAIINRDFLEAAGDRYLYETIARGRAHTAMFGWSADVYNQERLEMQDISNIIGYLRISAAGPLTYIFPGSNPGNKERGTVTYAKRCAECHGASGEGTGAPALNNQEFLSAASNGYLMAAMTIGRSGTAMPPWGYGEGKYPALTGKQRQDVVAFVRAWQRIRIKY